MTAVFMVVPYRQMSKPAHHGPLRSSIVIGIASFFLGGAAWLYADLRAFDPITPLTVVSSALIWLTFGWMPSLAMGGGLAGLEVLLGRQRQSKKRYGWLLMGASLGLLALWLAGMDVSISRDDFRIDPSMYSKEIRREGEALGPGGVGPYVEGYQAPRSQYVALKTLEGRRDDLREGERWVPSDLDAVEAAARENLQSDHQWLRELSRETLIWARLERLEPGGVARFMAEGVVPGGEVAEWLVDWERPGRPAVETRMNAADHQAVQRWAANSLPDGRRALEWSMEQMGPGAVESVFSQPLKPAAIDELLRGWCSTEGWSPLGADGKMSAADHAAVQLALDRLSRADDPLLHRQAEVYRSWIAAHRPSRPL